MQIPSRARGAAMVFAASLLWGGGSSFAVLIDEAGIDQFTVMIVRAAVVVLAAGAAALLRGPRTLAAPRDLLGLYSLAGVLILVGNLTLYNISCVWLSPAAAIILHYAFPLLTTAISAISARERPNAAQWLAGALVIVGLCVGFAAGRDVGEISPLGLALGTASLISASAQFIVLRRIGRRPDSNATAQLFWTHAAGGAALIICKSALLGWGDLANITLAAAPLFAYPALGISLLGYLLMYSGMKHIQASTASVISSMEVVSTLALMPFFIGVLPTARELCGALTLFAASALAALKGERSRIAGAK